MPFRKKDSMTTSMQPVIFGSLESRVNPVNKFDFYIDSYIDPTARLSGANGWDRPQHHSLEINPEMFPSVPSHNPGGQQRAQPQAAPPMKWYDTDL